MGLTVHYVLKANLPEAAAVRAAVEKIRQFALDLPFEHVGEIVDVKGDDCEFEQHRAELQKGERNESLAWMQIQASESVTPAWNKRVSYRFAPTRIIAFTACPGPGSEPANLGLGLYPAEIEREGRPIPTKLGGWRWQSFCKTQYASDPACGGVPNFLRCHISLITLLERAAKIPGLKVRIDDEGHYGPSTYADDYEAAHAAGRKPTYRRHAGRKSPARLAEVVGESNTMIASLAGALSDACAGNGIGLESPIKAFQNFEQLEFKGANSKHVGTFLTAMKKLATSLVPPETP